MLGGFHANGNENGACLVEDGQLWWLFQLYFPSTFAPKSNLMHHRFAKGIS